MYHYGIKDPNDNRLYHWDDKHPTGEWVGVYMINPQEMEVGKEYQHVLDMVIFMKTKIEVKTPWPRDNIALSMHIKRRV